MHVVLVNDLPEDMGLNSCGRRWLDTPQPDAGEELDWYVDGSCSVYEEEKGWLGVKTTGDYVGCLVMTWADVGRRVLLSETDPRIPEERCQEMKLGPRPSATPR
jgi:hypothetical protein